MSKFNVAVVGATGAVGEVILEVLAELNFPVETLFPLASKSSIGKTVMFAGSSIAVEELDTFDFKDADIALFSAGASVSEKYAPIAAANNCIVIDNTSQFRYEEDIPLIIPEINLDDLAMYKNKNIIANPNCSTIQMLMALAPLHRRWHIEEIVVSTYQSVSGAGRQAVSELVSQTTKLLNANPIESEMFQRQIAFNVIPQIDVWQDNDYCKEEMKMVWETKKILKDNDIKVNPTTVRVPTCYGHGESIYVKFSKNVTPDMAKDELLNVAGVKVCQKPEDFPTPFEDGASSDLVSVGRIRQAIDSDNALNMWVVADNIRKGAALNAVQIAKELAKDFI